MRVILFIFVLAGLTNAARESSDPAPSGAYVPQEEQRRSIARGAFTPAIDADSHSARAGP
jgi:hypothetical protein